MTVLVELGPAFVKLGQILSTRPDFMPTEYIEALSVLHENVPPFAFSEVERVVSAELEQPTARAFATFEQTPVASASLAQVHFATLPDGTAVAVKVQRPDADARVAEDLRVLAFIVRVASLAFPRLARNIDLVGAFEEFCDYTRRELDFHREAQTLERFRNNFRDTEHIKFPSVFWSHTAGRVLTMERVGGMRLHEVAECLSEEARAKLNARLVEMELQMFVRDAFFHADLHPGNIFFGADGTITVIDVGMVGKLTPEQRDRFLLYWQAVVDEDVDRAFHHIAKMVRPGSRADADGYREEFGRILRAFYRSTISERSWTKTFLELLVQAARFGYRTPGELLLEAKALTTAEALGFTLAPGSRFVDVARPFIIRELAKRASYKQVRRRLERTLPEWLVTGELPPPSFLGPEDANDKSGDTWNEVLRIWADEIEKHPGSACEVIHGEHTVLIEEPIDLVFNFVTRLARYEAWHPTYTRDSRVIHVASEWMFLAPQILGSVFRIDEIADGYHVQSNGIVTEFERNERFKWRAPFSPAPLLHIGTCFELEEAGARRTRLREYFYYLDNDIMGLLTNLPQLASLEALRCHIREELNGVKHILESGTYDREDVEFLWEGVHEPTRVAPNYLRPTQVSDGPRIRTHGHLAGYHGGGT